VVFAAGNTGDSGANTVQGPAAGYNVISVGALGSDTSNPAYNTRSAFSSRGAMDFFRPTVANVTNINDPSQGTIVAGARGRGDISAPGENLTRGHYGGAAGGD
ncbi:MAG TPA: S8 family serine peptidase, partial [Gemmatales bacterium]|nr:S8 family serine peptidase [Gemmatales bacterium]